MKTGGAKEQEKERGVTIKQEENGDQIEKRLGRGTGRTKLKEEKGVKNILTRN